jgi:hypothetical protein
MAIAASFTDFVVPGNGKVGIAEVTFTGTTDYVTNGVSPVAAILAATGLSQLTDLAPCAIGPSLAAGIFAYGWDKANSKLKLYTSAAAEVANAANISTIKAYFYVKGNY